MKLRNNVFKKKIKGIEKSMDRNRDLLKKAPLKIQKLRYMNKRKNRVESVRKRLQKKLKIVNLSNQ